MKLAALLLALSLFPIHLRAQQVPTISVTSRIVLLDATVVDERGHPVSGLTRDDFTIFEDNQPQTITSFEPPASHTLPPASTTPGLTLDVNRPEMFGGAPVSIFVLDEMNTRFADASYGVRSLRKYLESQPRTLPQAAAIFAVNNSRFQLLQSYTADRDLLLKALATHRIVYSWKLMNSNSIGDEVIDRLDLSLAALEQIAANSGAIDAHRNLFWLGAGFPSIDESPLTPRLRQQVKNAIQHVTDTLVDNRISLYAIDPTSSAASQTEITDPDQLAFAMMAEGLARDSDPFDHSLDLNKLSVVSGGRVIRGLNDVDHQIDLSNRLASSFYTLGYRPMDESLQAHSYRKIRVVCRRPGTRVLTRDGYYAGEHNSVSFARDTIQYDLNNAATAQVPLTAVPFIVASSADGAFVLRARSTRLTWGEAVSGIRDAHVQVLAVALDTRGNVLAHNLQSMTAHAPAALRPDIDSHDARFDLNFHAPGKARIVRFVIRDAATGRMGTQDLPLSKVTH